MDELGGFPLAALSAELLCRFEVGRSTDEGVQWGLKRLELKGLIDSMGHA
jgi:hypothetical protein